MIRNRDLEETALHANLDPLLKLPSMDIRPEFAFIERVRQRSRLRPEVLLGIGDDAAVLCRADRDWVTTVDVLMDGVHFDLSQTDPRLIGQKSLLVNISDVAAMAAEPVAAFVGIVFPRTMSVQTADEIYDGLHTAADLWNVSLAGGDTNSWDGPLVISVTLMGLTTEKGAVTRSGARPGDWLFVTGPLGGSFDSGRHLQFTPRVQEALTLHEHLSLTSMLDLSDGLASDLFHILDASDVGAKLDAKEIPIHDDVDSKLPFEMRLQRALNDGEDFELLFTVSPEEGRRLIENPLPGVRTIRIGEIVQGHGAQLQIADQVLPVERGGWTHQFGE